jgi:hypothetical protein
MKLKLCHDCGEWISASARRCPGCGAYHWTNGRIIFAVLILAFFVFFLRGVFL